MNSILIFIIVDSLLIILLTIFIIYLVLAKRSIDIEKRITKFSISSITDKPTSFFDRIYTRYDKLISSISDKLSKSKILSNYSKKYDKYIDKTKYIRNSAMDIITNKFLLSIMAVLITIVSDALRRHPVNIIQLIFALIVGFFIPDIFLALNHKKKQKQIENDLFKAVLIMSNAFKSGRSIMQAVKIVSEELDGPISEEFKKVYIDLNYGLELDVVFERLSNRIKMDETKYMASSLVILNKTGGNVVKVFDSIEKSFFERKKLNDELKSVTALSNFVFKILVAIPFIIFAMIYILNPHYFEPLISSGVGKLILLLIITLYILYIVIVKKIIKIRE